MEGKTHRIGGTVSALAGYLILKEQSLLISPEVVSPTLQFLTIYTAGIYGGIFPDIDHHWESSPVKDPLSWVVNKALHTFNKPYTRLDSQLSAKQKRNNLGYRLLKLLACRHRAWQTHSEFTLLCIVALWVGGLSSTSLVELTLRWLLLLGFGLGVISHLVLDMLTTEGIRLFTGILLNTFLGTRFPETIRAVPKSSFFKTGSEWELTIRRVLKAFQYILVIVVVFDLAGFDLVSQIRSILHL